MKSILRHSFQTASAVQSSLTRERLTWAVLEMSGKKTLVESDRESFLRWRSLVTIGLLRNQTSLLEHATLLILERSSFGSHFPDNAISSWLPVHRVMSWEILSHQKWNDSSSVLTRLPRAALDAPADHLMVYETALTWLERRELLFSKTQSGIIHSMMVRIVNSSLWNRRTLMAALAITIICLIPGLREILLGAIIGMMGASINEYTVHLGVGHASPSFTKGFRRLGIAGLFAEEINLAHRVHHCKMSTDFRSAFSTPETLRRVDAYVENEARKLVESRFGAGITSAENRDSEIARIISEIKAGGYGIDGTLAGCLAMNFLASPYFIANAFITKFALSPLVGPTLAIIFLISSFIFLSGFIMQSLFSHRYLHMTDADLEASKATKSTTRFMRWYMTTEVARLQTRRHYRHHHEKFDYHGTANGVIMSFSFADFIFRGGVKEAEAGHLARMKEEGFLPSFPTRKS